MMTSASCIATSEPGESRPIFRKALPGEEPVILDPWWKQVRKARPYSLWSIERFWGYKESAIEPLLIAPGVVIASNPDYCKQVYGWACGEVLDDGINVLHMVYVREPHRGRRIGQRLAATVCPALGSCPVYYTFRTRSTNYWEKRWQLIYAPQLVHRWYPRKKEHDAQNQISAI